MDKAGGSAAGLQHRDECTRHTLALQTTTRTPTPERDPSKRDQRLSTKVTLQRLLAGAMSRNGSGEVKRGPFSHLLPQGTLPTFDTFLDLFSAHVSSPTKSASSPPAPAPTTVSRTEASTTKREGWSSNKPPFKNILVLSGAGTSTSAGIPDFRSPGTGLYDNLKKYDLDYPEEIFGLDLLRSRPEAFFTLSRDLYPGKYAPTLSHTFYTLLSDANVLLRVFTQNIDTLERLAGLQSDKIVEAHGSFASAKCVECEKGVEEEWMREHCMLGKVARCDECGGVCKPDIVFFGEALPERFVDRLQDLQRADCLLILGTSLKVHPFASLITRVPRHIPRILINLEKVGDDQWGGLDFEGDYVEEAEDARDVWSGERRTDEVVREICKRLGWEEELLRRNAETRKKLLGKGDEASPADKTRLGTPEAVSAAQEKAQHIAKDVASISLPKDEPDVGGSKDITARDDHGNELSQGIKELDIEQKGKERDEEESTTDDKERKAGL